MVEGNISQEFRTIYIYIYIYIYITLKRLP